MIALNDGMECVDILKITFHLVYPLITSIYGTKFSKLVIDDRENNRGSRNVEQSLVHIAHAQWLGQGHFLGQIIIEFKTLNSYIFQYILKPFVKYKLSKNNRKCKFIA
jgi:hypothetical protein